MVDVIPSNCPYCGKATTYAWRRKKVGHAPMGVTMGMVVEPSLDAIEIYCTNCNRTLSITPEVKKSD